MPNYEIDKNVLRKAMDDSNIRRKPINVMEGSNNALKKHFKDANTMINSKGKAKSFNIVHKKCGF
ncbi:MAG: hypothetical protein ACI4U0_02795 [Candidatus Aphodocola sp.]